MEIIIQLFLKPRSWQKNLRLTYKDKTYTSLQGQNPSYSRKAAGRIWKPPGLRRCWGSRALWLVSSHCAQSVSAVCIQLRFHNSREQDGCLWTYVGSPKKNRLSVIQEALSRPLPADTLWCLSEVQPLFCSLLINDHSYLWSVVSNPNTEINCLLHPILFFHVRPLWINHQHASLFWDYPEQI
jgi:hypothetical protein